MRVYFIVCYDEFKFILETYQIGGACVVIRCSPPIDFPTVLSIE